MYSIKTTISCCTEYAGICDACYDHIFCSRFNDEGFDVPYEVISVSEEEHEALMSTTYLVEDTAICYPQYMAGWRIERLKSALKELPEEVAKSRAELYLDLATKRYKATRNKDIKILIEFYRKFLKGGEF